MREIITDKFRHDLQPPVHRTTEQKKVQFVSVISVTETTYFYVIINIFFGRGWGQEGEGGGGRWRRGGGCFNLLSDLVTFLLTCRREMQSLSFASTVILHEKITMHTFVQTRA